MVSRGAGDPDLELVRLRPAQRSALPPFHTLRAFEAIISCGGIRRAAEALSVDHAAVSRHLRALEDWIGLPLIDRAPGAGRRLTADGERLYRVVARSLGEISDTVLDLRGQDNDSRLALVCAPGLASAWLTGRIGQFQAIAPGVDIELQPLEMKPQAGQHDIDIFVHYVPDILVQDLDPALRSMELVRPRIVPVASPDLVARLPQASAPEALLDFPLVHEASYDQWRRWFAAHGIDAGTRLSGLRLWHTHLTMEAARQGQGVALSNAVMAADDLRRGTLVEVGGWAPVHLGRYVFTTRLNRWRDKTIADFRRWLHRTIAQDLKI